jgi:hypothetical protein
MQRCNAFVLAVLIAFCACACHPNHVDWPKTVADCADAAQDLVPVVSSVFLNKGTPESDDAELAEIAGDNGPGGASLVKCAVDLFLNRLHEPGATQTPARTQAAGRAAAFMQRTSGEPGAYLWPLHGYAAEPMAFAGFTPLELPRAAPVPWHVVLASARGQA